MSKIFSSTDSSLVGFEVGIEIRSSAQCMNKHKNVIFLFDGVACSGDVFGLIS
jgi:hypothetical protein